MRDYLYKRASFRKLPGIEAGCKMPSHDAIIAQDRARVKDATEGSAALLAAIARHHPEWVR